jgi:prepilin-type N-terminal cleavage/methylation domain-containing protein
MGIRRGFTLIEVLVASMIMVLVVAAAFSTYVILSRYISDTTSQGLMQSRARIVMERIVRDTRLASDVVCSGGGTILTLTYTPETVGKSGQTWTAQYRLTADGELLYTPNLGPMPESVIMVDVAPAVGERLFQYDGGRRTVSINIRTDRAVLDKEIKVRTASAARLRNGS